MADRAEVRPCYYFTCDDCGADTFVYPIPADNLLTEEQKRALTGDNPEETDGVGDEEEIQWYYCPGQSACKHCGKEYELFREFDDLTEGY